MSFLGDLINTIGGAAHNVGQGVGTMFGQPDQPQDIAARRGEQNLRDAQARHEVNQNVLAANGSHGQMFIGVPPLKSLTLGHTPQQQLQIGQPNMNMGHAGWSGIQRSTSLDDTMQGNPDFSPQGGQVNPGYIPFQNSGFGGGYAQNLQPTLSVNDIPQHQSLRLGR